MLSRVSMSNFSLGTVYPVRANNHVGGRGGGRWRGTFADVDDGGRRGGCRLMAEVCLSVGGGMKGQPLRFARDIPR